MAPRKAKIIPTIEREWITCPRCKNRRLTPDVLEKNSDGSNSLWWICENFEVCAFPLDMPPNIFHVDQTAYQAGQGYYPMPKIKELPPKYRNLYPLTFPPKAPGETESRCISVLSNKKTNCESLNSSNEPSDCASVSLKSDSGITKNFIVAEKTNIEGDETPSSSSEKIEAMSGTVEEGEENGGEINDDEIEREMRNERRPLRMVPRQRKGTSKRSWRRLIENLASDKDICTDLLNMEESQMFSRMEEILKEMSYQIQATRFTKKSRRVTFKIDDIEIALRQCPLNVDWEEARKKMNNLSRDNKMALCEARNSDSLLQAVGVETEKEMKINFNQIKEERQVLLSQRIERLMNKLMNTSTEADPNCPEMLIKRRKVENQKNVVRKEKEIASKVVESAKARVLNKLKIRQTYPSVNSTVSSEKQLESCSETLNNSTKQNEKAPEASTREFEMPLEEVSNDEWGLNLDGLLDDYEQNDNEKNNRYQEDTRVVNFEREEEQNTEDVSNLDNFDEVLNIEFSNDDGFITDNFGF